MSEFPEDVLFVARSLVWPQYLGNEATVERIIIGDCDSWPLVITAAKAILAERERCAKVGRSAVMKFRGKVGGRYYAGYHEDMRDAVADAIRDGNEK